MMIGLGVTKAMTSGLTLDEFWILRVSHSVTQTVMVGMGYISIFYQWRGYEDYHFIGLLCGTVSSMLWISVYVFGSMDMIKWANYGLASWALGGGEFERVSNLVLGIAIFVYYGSTLYDEIKALKVEVNQEICAIMGVAIVMGCGIERFAQP